MKVRLFIGDGTSVMNSRSVSIHAHTFLMMWNHIRAGSAGRSRKWRKDNLLVLARLGDGDALHRVSEAAKFPGLCTSWDPSGGVVVFVTSIWLHPTLARGKGIERRGERRNRWSVGMKFAAVCGDGAVVGVTAFRGCFGVWLLFLFGAMLRCHKIWTQYFRFNGRFVSD